MTKGSLLYQIANKLKRARLKKGLSQRKLAKIIKIPHSEISLIEKGKRNITILTLSRIVAALGLKFSFK